MLVSNYFLKREVTHLKDRIVISPTSRQEGHAELVMEVDDEGIVTKGRYLSITPVRGLEKMVAGKNPETAPVLCQRICGVCPIRLQSSARLTSCLTHNSLIISDIIIIHLYKYNFIINHLVDNHKMYMLLFSNKVMVLLISNKMKQKVNL